MLATKKAFHWIPGYPFCNVVDPTGAGDSYAGALFSYLDNKKNINEQTILDAMIYASSLSSFTIEKFGIDRLLRLKKSDIRKRETELKKIARL